MSTTRSTVAVAMITFLAVLAGGWFLLVSPQRSEAASLRTERTGVEASISALRVQLETLKAQAAGLPEQEAALAELAQRIPTTPQLPSVVRSLTAAATKSGATLSAITPGAQTAVGGAAVVTPVASAEGAPAPGGGVAAPTAPALTAVPLDLLVSGSFVEIERFINGIESIKRSFLVTSFTLESSDADGGSRELKLALSGRVFTATSAAPTLTAAAPVAAGAAPATPAATPAQ